MSKKNVSAKQREALLGALKARFENNIYRHKGLKWSEVKPRLETDTVKLYALNEMEITGGEPDVVAYDKKAGEYLRATRLAPFAQ